MTSDYQPIACGAYDEIEVLAMQRAEVGIELLDDAGVGARHTGQVIDTAIHDRAEFLVLLEDGERREIRLDRIARIQDASGREIWRQKTD